MYKYLYSNALKYDILSCFFSHTYIFFSSAHTYTEAFYKKRGINMFSIRSIIRDVSAILLAVCLSALLTLTSLSYPESYEAISSVGSRGAEVRAVQQKLKERGLFHEDITGYYGEKTRQAVIAFQKQRGITPTGTAGPLTLKALGISVGSIPPATESNIYLLAKIISAEARGEPYTGQVAVGAVILNRIEHPSFPDTLSGVIYQNGAFTAVVDGQINQPISDSAYSAARDALNGWDPTYGCIYYYNPSKTSNSFMWSRPVVVTIGAHRFCT